MELEEGKWERRPKLRDDDPYHAWAYHGAPESEGLCALVVEVRFPEADEPGASREALMGRLERLLEAIREGDTLTVSEYDERHIFASLEALAEGFPSDETWSAASTLYLRMFLLYAKEHVIFPRGDARNDGSNGLATTQWEDVFEIRHVGSPARSQGTKENLRLSHDLLPQRRASDLVIIDDSIAFLNAAFRRPDGGTRFDHLWFQAIERPGTGQAIEGARLEPDDVERLLDEIRDPASPRSEASTYLSEVTAANLGFTFRPADMTSAAHQPLAHAESHGTHVAATALRAYEAHGGDPDALGLSAITIPTEVTEDTSGSTLSAYFLAAVRQAMLWNDARAELGQAPPPLVISCSYGYLAGLKDGTDPLSRVVSDLLEARNALGRPTALVLPMGNAFESRAVAHAEIEPDGEMAFDLVVAPDDRTPSFLDLFATDLAEPGALPDLEIEVAPPHSLPVLGVGSGDLGPQERLVLLSASGERLAEWGAWTLPADSDFGFRGTLGLEGTTNLARPGRTVPHGRWHVTIRNRAEDRSAEVWAFVQRDDAPGTFPRRGRQARLQTPLSHEFDGGPDPHATLNYDALGSGDTVIEKRCVSVLACMDSRYVFVAGAGEGRGGDALVQDAVRPSRYASAGPRDGDRPGVLGTRVNGPEFSALSDRDVAFPGIFGAATLSGSGVAVSGSSVAAPQVAGLLAARPDLIGTAKIDVTTANPPNPQGTAPRGPRFGTVLGGGP